MTDKLYMIYLIKGHSPFFYFFTFLPFYLFTFKSPFLPFYLFTFKCL